MAELWKARLDAMSALDASLRAEATILYAAFDLTDELLAAFQALSPRTDYARISGLTLLKARNLAHGSLSLSLDGLAREAGALLRVMIEALELLMYLREDPRRVEEVLEERLPSAGEPVPNVSAVDCMVFGNT